MYPVYTRKPTGWGNEYDFCKDWLLNPELVWESYEDVSITIKPNSMKSSKVLYLPFFISMGGKVKDIIICN